MMEITWKTGEKDDCVCQGAPGFQMNGDPDFANRKIRFWEDSLLFDGYSVWFESSEEWKKTEGNFTASFCIAPLEYAETPDGLFSCFDREKKQGFYAASAKDGEVRAGFGTGTAVFEVASLKEHLKKRAFNWVSVVYWQDAGWLDLYVNGMLSNRKQFPRHAKIDWPEKKAWIGRHQDSADADVRMGIFYGWFQKALIQDRRLSEEEIRKLHQEKQGICMEGSELDRNIFEKDVHRPGYHLIAAEKWMNEPHAPFYYDGYYHIFHQANIHAPIFNHLQWAHLVSRDMVHWEDMPLALETEKSGIDPDGCWSGSALVDKEGIPRIFYTAGNHKELPNQGVALASAFDRTDKRLPAWEKHPELVVSQDIGFIGEFRDPFVWEEEGIYYMLVGTGDSENGGGNAAVYRSENLVDWESHGFVTEYDFERNPEVGHVWELPVMLPLRDENNEIVCHVLMMCACQIENEVVETYYFLGHWDREKMRFSPMHERAMLFDLGCGVFTGPSGFVTPDFRSVVFTIAQGKRGWKEEFHAGWAHNGGLPVELSIWDGKLCICPIRELYGLKKECLVDVSDVLQKDAEAALEGCAGNRLWMKLCAHGERPEVTVTCGTTETTVYYDRQTGVFGAEDGNGKQLSKCRGELDKVFCDEEEITLECFVDGSMIEMYLNGRKGMSLRNYGDGKTRSIRLGEKTGRVRKLELWSMETAYGGEKENGR